MPPFGGIAGGAASIFTLGGRAGVFTGAGDGGGTGGLGLWERTLGGTRGFSLGSGWVCCGRNMSWMQVGASKRSLCIVAGTSLMEHDRKWRAWTMRSSGVTVG